MRFRIRDIGFSLLGIGLVVLAIVLMQPEPEPELEVVTIPVTPSGAVPEVPADSTRSEAQKIVQKARERRVATSFKRAGHVEQGAATKQRFMQVIERQTKSMRYEFAALARSIEVQFEGGEVVATESVDGNAATRLDPGRYGENIVGTDLIYADLVQGFWSWPNPKLGEEDSRKITFGIRREACVLRLDNPNPKSGPHAVVKIWIDKESSALLKVDSFDWNGRKVRSYEVTGVQKDKALGKWVAEKIRVRAIDNEGGNIVDSTLEFELSD